MPDAPPPPPPALVRASADEEQLPEGRSVEGRRLVVQRRGSRDAERRILVVGQIHGDEPGGRRVIAALRRRRAPEGSAIYTIASANPDGAAARTRVNARGVDLNRNFPGDWRPGPRGRYHPGRRAGSEPETRWVRRVVRTVRPDVTVWFHQPYGMVDLSRGASRSLVRAYARRVRLPARRLPRLHGTATGWQNRTFDATSAFVVELGARRPTDAEVRRHLRAIRAIARGD